MKVGRVSSFKIEGVEKQTASALSSILCNIDEVSINGYLHDRGGLPNLLSKKDVDELVSLGRLINQSLRGE